MILTITAGVVTSFLFFADVGIVVINGTSVGRLLLMMVATAKRAAYILASGVTSSCNKANAAMATGNRAVSDIWVLVKDLVQRELILLKERLSAILPIPILAKSVNFCEADQKKPNSRL